VVVIICQLCIVMIMYIIIMYSYVVITRIGSDRGQSNGHERNVPKYKFKPN
jgi:hypothetical protein